MRARTHTCAQLEAWSRKRSAGHGRLCMKCIAKTLGDLERRYAPETSSMLVMSAWTRYCAFLESLVRHVTLSSSRDYFPQDHGRLHCLQLRGRARQRTPGPAPDQGVGCGHPGRCQPVRRCVCPKARGCDRFAARQRAVWALASLGQLRKSWLQRARRAAVSRCAGPCVRRPACAPPPIPGPTLTRALLPQRSSCRRRCVPQTGSGARVGHSPRGESGREPVERVISHNPWFEVVSASFSRIL